MGERIERLMTTTEVGAAFGVSQVAVWFWCSKGRGPVQPVAQVGRRYLFRADDVERALRERKGEAA